MNRIPRTATVSKLLLSIFHLRPSAFIRVYLSSSAFICVHLRIPLEYNAIRTKSNAITLP